MIYCKIEDGLVTDRVFFDTAMPTDWPEYDTFVQNDEAQIGWSYADGTFTPPPQLEPNPPPPPSPETVVLLDHENRIREQEGVPPLTLGDFVDKMRSGPELTPTKKTRRK